MKFIITGMRGAMEPTRDNYMLEDHLSTSKLGQRIKMA